MRSVAEIVDQVGVPFWQHKREFIPFCEWLREQNVKSVLEIGTGFGGSAYVFGEITNHGKIVSVDFNKLMQPEQRREQPNPNFVQINGDSRTDEVETLISRWAPFDLVFFDTEHPYENCVDNFARYAKMATRFIAQHDINMDEVNWPDAGLPKFWREFSAGKTVVEFIAPDPDPRFPRWGGIGVVSL